MLTEKQYEALRTAKVAEARKHGISEAQLESYGGELFDGEREYLIRKNPPGGASALSQLGAGSWVMIVLSILMLAAML
jgi:hypothetical protein